MHFETVVRTWLAEVTQLATLPTILGKLSILLGTAWCVHFALQRCNPRWRVLLWRVVATGILSIPILHLSAPAFQLSKSTSSIPAHTVGSSRGDLIHDLEQRTPETMGPGKISPGADFFAHAPPASREVASSTDWPLWLVSVWFCGFVFFAVRTVIGLLRIRRLQRSSESAPIAVQTEFTRVAKQLAVRTPVEVRVSHCITAPILCGVGRSTLLIPPTLARPSRSEELPAVFAHELAHLRAGDLRWNLFLHAVTVILWFHPFVWRIRAVHAAACESVSDAVAVGFIGDVQAYGRTLARVALDAVRLPQLSLAMARTHDVSERVQSLERNAFVDGLSPKLIVSVLLFGLPAVAALGSFKVVFTQSAAAATPFPVQQGDPPQASGEQQPAGADENASAESDASLVTAETKVAVSKALAFLAAQQRADGSFGGKQSGQNDSALTALCGLAFLSARQASTDNTKTIDPHDEVLQKTIRNLMKATQPNGFIGTGGSMYVHAYALRFLADVQASQPSPALKNVVTAGVELIVKSQNAADGWRYIPTSQDADSSVSSCQLIALQSARRAGVEVPADTVKRAVAYLKSCQTKDGGFAYVLPVRSSALPRTAAVLSALCLSSETDEPVSRGFAYLHARGRSRDHTSPYFFFTEFHLSNALRYAEDDHFVRWYGSSRDHLLRIQQEDGSWPLQYHEPVYPTAQAIVTLLSPRFLNSRPDGE